MVFHSRVFDSRCLRAAGIAIIALCLRALPAAAQTDPPRDPDADATMRLGPLSMQSSFALNNIGVDTNVFNEADVDRPERDFTMTFTPTTNLWVRLGRTWVDATIRVDWVYYNRFATERSANSTYRVGASRTFNRLSLRAGAGRLSTRDRPGFEIDARSQRLETSVDASGDFRIFSRTHLGARSSRRRVVFDQGAVFRAISLSQELNRSTTATAFVVRHELTPLTTALIELGREQDRFAFSSQRDADSTRMVGTLRFQPLALINGAASVGYRHFRPLAADVPRFKGLTTSVDVSYSFLGATRFGFQAVRDVQPSFEPDQPYYLETGTGVSVQQQVYGPFDLLARTSRRSLAYRDRARNGVRASGRVDHVRVVGLGAGYRLGTDKRVGFAVDHQRRSSGVDAVRYSGLRYGFSVTYER